MPVLFELLNITIPGIANRLNLKIEPGMVAFIITPGETESELLFQTLLGEQIPDYGSVMFDEQCLHQIERSELLKIRRTIGTVTANTNLLSNLKVWENITLPVIYHTGLLTAEAAEQAMYLLEETGMSENLWALPGHLSAVERIMTAFIRAVISVPRLLIVRASLDELPGMQRKTFINVVEQLRTNNAMASLFLATGTIQLSDMQPDITVDLRQSPVLITRRQ